MRPLILVLLLIMLTDTNFFPDQASADGVTPAEAKLLRDEVISHSSSSLVQNPVSV